MPGWLTSRSTIRSTSSSEPAVVSGRKIPDRPDLAGQRVQQAEGDGRLSGEAFGRCDIDAATHRATLAALAPADMDAIGDSAELSRPERRPWVTGGTRRSGRSEQDL